MTDDQPLDPDLAARLRASSEARIAAQVQAARQQAAQQADARAEFGRRRRVGVGHRNAAREARIRLAQRHDKPEENQ